MRTHSNPAPNAPSASNFVLFPSGHHPLSSSKDAPTPVASRPTPDSNTNASKAPASRAPTQTQRPTTAPPRPPRNPARPSRPSSSSGRSRSTSARPATSSGVTESSSAKMGSFSSPTPSRKPSLAESARPSRKPSLVASDRPSRTSTTPTTKPPSPKAPNPNPDPNPDPSPKFSTADRTILAELARTIAARSAQFTTKSGKRHHPFPPGEVPYPRSYERGVVDLDVWEGQFVRQVCGSVTWHVFEEPPTKVLDLGCGTGTWILDCAKVWKDCHFVGLDVVPLQPDLLQVGSGDLAQRVRWVQANFLEGLPFPNEEFDLVHVKRIARGVPEDKWDFLFEEITRVMKPGGAFEMIEEDLYFPGMAREEDVPSPSPSTSTSPPSSFRPGPGSGSGPRQRSDSVPQPRTNKSKSSSSPPTPTTRKKSPQPQPPPRRTHRHSFASSLMFLSDISVASTLAAYTDSANNSRAPSRKPSLSMSSNPRSPKSTTTDVLLRTSPHAPANPRDHSLLEVIYSEMHSARFINLSPLSLLGNYLSLYFKNVRTHPPILVTFPPLSRTPTYDPHEHTEESDEDEDSFDSHSEMYSSPPRFASFSGVPPRSPLVPPPRPCQRRSTYVSSTEVSQNTQPFVTLDKARISVIMPKFKLALGGDEPARQPFPTGLPMPLQTAAASHLDLPATSPLSSRMNSPKSPTAAARAKENALPNSTFNFDLRSLNLHLSARVSEILACAEAMWAWVAEYQKKYQPERTRSSKSRTVLDEQVVQTLANMTRTDFELLLTHFDQDMRDYIAFGSILEDRFGWNAPLSQRTQDRKLFDLACEQYADYLKKTPREPEGKLKGSLRRRPRQHSSAAAISTPKAEEYADIRRSKSDAHRRRVTVNANAKPTTEPHYASPSPRSSEETPSRPSSPSARLSRTIRVFVAWKA